MPRDVDPRINELDGVYLYDIDSLQAVAKQSLVLRRQQIVAAEEIIAQHVVAFREILARSFNRNLETPEHPAIGERSLRTSEL